VDSPGTEQVLTRKEIVMAGRDVAIEQHPDLAELQARYDRMAQTPTAQFVAGLTLLAGLYLTISPWVVGFRVTAADLRVTDLICGAVVALLAIGYASAYGRTHGLSWVTPVIGAWTVVAPWVVLGGTPDAGTIISNVICGGVIVVLGIATAAMAGRHGAWR
jgi:SPW repeat-containing protein